jgi:YidC/Oxa1 family membrane protein insertase
MGRWTQFEQRTTALAPTAENVAATPTTPTQYTDAKPHPEGLEDAPLPSVPPSNKSTEPQLASKTPKLRTGSIIEIKTDVLELQINLRGGDIEYLALPQYPKKEYQKEPLLLMEKNAGRRFLAQSGLLQYPRIGQSNERLNYSAAKDRYFLQEDEDMLRVALHYDSSQGIDIKKYFTLYRGSYKVHVSYEIHNRSPDVWRANMFGQFQRGDYPDPNQESSTFSPASFLGVAMYTPEKPYSKFHLKDLRKTPIKRPVEGGWIAFVQRYFVSAWIPPAGDSHLYRAVAHEGNRYLASWVSPVYEFIPDSKREIGIDFYAGPKIQKDLAALSPALDLTTDYGWLWWLSQPLAFLLNWLHAQLNNWGAAIIALTCLIKLIFYPLSNIGYRSMARMRLVQPRIVTLRERYGSDRQRLSQELMDLYRKEKINPMGGCLPILVQMPVFLALYWVLLESVELRHAPFFGWITDLSVRDPWFVLPVLMGASMFVQQRLNPTPPDPMQAAILKWMPIVFTLFFMFFPAGLVLYWVINNLLSMLQQLWVNLKISQE